MISLVFANSVFSNQDWLMAEGYRNIKIPILVTHGDKDTLTSFEGSKIFTERVLSQDKRFQGYPGYFHERKNGGLVHLVLFLFCTDSDLAILLSCSSQ